MDNSGVAFGDEFKNVVKDDTITVNYQLSIVNFSPQGLLNVEKNAVENFRRKIPPQSLLKTYDSCTVRCGEISVATLSKI